MDSRQDQEACPAKPLATARRHRGHGCVSSIPSGVQHHRSDNQFPLCFRLVFSSFRAFVIRPAPAQPGAHRFLPGFTEVERENTKGRKHESILACPAIARRQSITSEQVPKRRCLIPGGRGSVRAGSCHGSRGGQPRNINAVMRLEGIAVTAFPVFPGFAIPTATWLAALGFWYPSTDSGRGSMRRSCRLGFAYRPLGRRSASVGNANPTMAHSAPFKV